MQVADNKAVFFHYTLTDNDGEVIDSSDGGDPLAYIHGAGGIIPGLAKEMTGKKVGDIFNVTVDPAEGYGEREDGLTQTVPIANFGGQEVEEGMQFQARTNSGVRIFTVVEVSGSDVIIDGNHPLAGVTLNFHVEITEIRDATKEEIAHGHIHGPGGHHH